MSDQFGGPQKRLRKIFPQGKPIIGMVHIFAGDREDQVTRAREDIAILQGYVDGVLFENYNWGNRDGNSASSQTLYALYTIAEKLMPIMKIPFGFNVLPNDYQKALFLARELGGKFIQLDHIVGEFLGCTSVDPKEFMREREIYDDILVFGGIHPKYYTLTDTECSLVECAKKAQALTDGVVITGRGTGYPVRMNDIRITKVAIGDHPIIIGSGLTADNADSQLLFADGAIVGTALKRYGVRDGEPVDRDCVRILVEAVKRVRKNS